MLKISFFRRIVPLLNKVTTLPVTATDENAVPRVGKMKKVFQSDTSEGSATGAFAILSNSRVSNPEGAPPLRLIILAYFPALIILAELS